MPLSLRRRDAQGIPLLQGVGLITAPLLGPSWLPSLQKVSQGVGDDLPAPQPLSLPPHLGAAGWCPSCSGQLWLRRSRLWASRGLPAQHHQSQRGERPRGATGTKPDSSPSTLNQQFHADLPWGTNSQQGPYPATAGADALRPHRRDLEQC